MKRSRLTLLLLILVVSINAQDRRISISNLAYGWDNRNFALCWYNDKDVYNIGSYKICSPGRIFDIKMSPAGTSFALLSSKGNFREVGIYSYIDGRLKHVFRFQDMPTAIAYSANAKQLCIGDAARHIRVYSTLDYKLQRTIPVAVAPKKLELSENGYYIAASDEHILYVWNFETGKVRKVMELESAVNDIAFSADNNKMAVLTERGLLYIYDTRDYSLLETYEGMGDAKECVFHPQGKYISVIIATDRVTIINMKDPTRDRKEIKSENVGIRHINYARATRGTTSLAYNAGKEIIFHPIDDLVPDYQHLLSLEVEEKMDDWMHQMPGETLEAYYERVNDESRALQYQKFENEVATEMAGNQVEQSQMSFGNYDQDENLLEISFDNMPNIYLQVPQEDVASFSKPENLKFENSVYAVREDDGFELLYTEVTNTETGKSYVFNNLEKQKLEYMSSNDNFVPLELIQQSSMEEIKLQQIREDVVSAAKQAALISEHTHIDVKTKVEKSVNADGEKIMNYVVDFSYDVEQEFTAIEDFQPGRYVISESQSALAMLQIVQNAFRNEFKQYLVNGKKVIINVTGSADAIPIKGKLAYKEEYGALEDALVYVRGELTTLSVSKASGITSNEQLAFVRATGVKNYLENSLPELDKMAKEYNCYINVSNYRGAEYRRIGVKFIFVDAF